uniref:Small ribosomal subunit protein uS8c n=1 Tax=Chlorodesmis fastigiata TaxID=189431 RepID=A0A2P0QHF9_CHLFS|nr:ribosomal protein S8 [Chlorodesmis fastigiata]ARO74204.1 ribosomal protein S8 [Chlorodesmis fastigiata]
MINDTISDFFTRIRNASLICRDTVRVSKTKTNQSLVRILAHHGFITSFIILDRSLVLKLTKNQQKQTNIVQIQRLSRPGCRLYVNFKKIPRIYGKLGLILLSTSYGILSDREASNLKIGGEIIGFIT